MSEGYLLIATGDASYAELANNAARSLRAADRKRGIAIVMDEATGPRINLDLFTRKIMLPNRLGKLRGTEIHLHMDRLSPFDRTFYVDTDCMVGSAVRLGLAWRDFKHRPVVIHGEVRQSGDWRVPIDAVMREFKIPHVVKNNGGIVYFDKSRESSNFFNTARRLFSRKPKSITIRHVKGGGFANEPFWAVALALQKLPPVTTGYGLNTSARRIAAFTVSAGEVELVRDGEITRPVFIHFLGLGGEMCCNALYQEMLSQLNQTP